MNHLTEWLIANACGFVAVGAWVVWKLRGVKL